ncbi:BTB/POZ domain-containing protein [Iris pallida]|uniref:BTB/POZ domain-containing protein n=1 Tax=Iris pallida TaxID=29817 RepID=A0AAX6EJD6_IRIPA|nr:BTB/POZ domain-containing protein [Iris pallida]
MSESAYRVETAPRLAQWRIDTLSSCTYRKSDPFKIGIWNWFLTVERNKQLFVKLYPEVSALTREQPPIASFVIKLISSSSPNRKTLVHPGVSDKQIKTNEDFVWAVDTVFTGKFIIDVEFLDLKSVPLSGGEPVSIWSACQTERHSLSTAITSLSRMLSDSILTDITITGADGAGIGAPAPCWPPAPRSSAPCSPTTSGRSPSRQWTSRTCPSAPAAPSSATSTATSGATSSSPTAWPCSAPRTSTMWAT